MTDLISRRAAIKAIDDLPNCYNGYSDTYDKACIIGVLEELPTIEPKRGNWETEVRTIRGHKIAFFACSVCGRNADGEYPYCPNCGARMSDECAD